jgi:hypothetical protein
MISNLIDEQENDDSGHKHTKSNAHTAKDGRTDSMRRPLIQRHCL